MKNIKMFAKNFIFILIAFIAAYVILLIPTAIVNIYFGDNASFIFMVFYILSIQAAITTYGEIKKEKERNAIYQEFTFTPMSFKENESEWKDK